MRLDVYVTVWDKPYVEKFLAYSLASQLAPANLPAAARDAEVVYHIYTDRASEAWLAPGMAALAPVADVRLSFFEDLPFRGGTIAQAIATSEPRTLKHNVQRATSHHFLTTARDARSDAVILLDSDFIFADGAWPAMLAAHRAGARAVCAMFLRLAQEEAAPRLAGRLTGGIAPRTLAALGLDTLHPIARAMFVDADPFTGYPSQINWRVGEGGRAGFITHCFFPHPLLVVPQGAVTYSSTMDYEYALRAVADDAAIHLVRSSDELLLCKMTAGAYNADSVAGGSAALAALARFAVANTNLRHRLFMAQPIRFRAGGDDADWEAVETLSRRFVDALYKAAELVVAGARGDPRTMMFLKSFLGPIEDFLSPQAAARINKWT